MHLERLSLILEIVGQRGEASVAEICAAADLPRASAYRLVQDLAAAGLLAPAARGRFAIGARLKRIALPEQTDRALVERVAPVLKQAATRHGAAFFLSRLRGRAVEIIHVEAPDTGVSFLHPGLGKRPLHACSCSKAVAAVQPALLQAQRLDGPLKAYTDLTLTRLDDLKAELAGIRERGYAECVEEIERGMCSVAATLGDAAPWATMSIGATGSTRIFTPAFRAHMGREVMQLADGIRSELRRDGPERTPEPA